MDLRFRRALERNHVEVEMARINLEIWAEMKKMDLYTHTRKWFTWMALYEDSKLRVIRVLEINTREETAAFWDVLRRAKSEGGFDPSPFEEDLGKLDKISHRLKIPRDKTLFHIDKQYVENPNNAWDQAGISIETEFVWATVKIREILEAIWSHVFQDSPPSPYKMPRS